ncbi:MAG: AMP-binding protein [Bacteroidales bacterium]|jgi:O-succinylbenzoic acid--CoA ligase|nr:AMP-binding protein [Bacteroidales bacterium]
MNINEPIIINNKSFTKAELIKFAFETLESEKLADWESDIYQFILAFFDDEVTLVQRTSGTTGDPKSVVLKREAMVHSAKMTLDYFKLKKGDNALLCLPVQYIAGKMMVIRALLGGLNLITVEPTSNPLKHNNEEIHFAAMVPLQVFQTMEDTDRFKKVHKLIIGGGEIMQDLLEDIRKLEDVEVYETFAMSETCSHFAVRRLNGKKPESKFSTLKGVEIAVDKRGCLLVDIKGITNGSVQSNDLIEITGKSKFKWLGRIDNVINCGGKKIIPEILEAKIRSIINHELLIIGIPDSKLGQRLVLAVEANPKSSPVSTWKKSLTQLLTKHEVPKEIHCIPKFPRNKSMKVERMAVKGLITR